MSTIRLVCYFCETVQDLERLKYGTMSAELKCPNCKKRILAMQYPLYSDMLFGDFECCDEKRQKIIKMNRELGLF